MVKSGVLGLLFSAYSLVAGQAQQRTRSSNATVASSASIHAAFEPPVQIGSSNLTKFWFSRLGATGHHDTLVAPAQRGGDGSALPCRAHDGCSGKLFTTVDGGSSWNPAGPTGLSSINPDEGEFIAIIPRNEPAGSFLTLGYEQTLSPDGLSTTGCADNRLWADKGAGKLQVLRAANVTITGFPQPLRGIVFNPRPVLLPDGEWLAPLYGTFRDPPLGCNASSSGECSSVFFARSVDAGMGERWQYASHIDRSADWMPWVDSEGPCEPSVVLLPDGRLMTAMRVDARSMLFHAFSDDGTPRVCTMRLQLFRNFLARNSESLELGFNLAGVLLWVSQVGRIGSTSAVCQRGRSCHNCSCFRTEFSCFRQAALVSSSGLGLRRVAWQTTTRGLCLISHWSTTPVWTPAGNSVVTLLTAHAWAGVRRRVGTVTRRALCAVPLRIRPRPRHTQACPS